MDLELGMVNLKTKSIMYIILGHNYNKLVVLSTWNSYINEQIMAFYAICIFKFIPIFFHMEYINVIIFKIICKFNSN